MGESFSRLSGAPAWVIGKGQDMSVMTEFQGTNT